jgi:hypothetical protein
MERDAVGMAWNAARSDKPYMERIVDMEGPLIQIKAGSPVRGTFDDKPASESGFGAFQ